MNNKSQILDLYYNQQLKQCEIVKKLHVSKQYVSKVIKADERYKQVKEQLKQDSAKKRILYLKEYFKNYTRPKKDDNSYEQLLALQKQDSLELSYGSGYLSDYSYAKWNSSAYHTNSNGNLILDKNLKVGCDVPKTINMNIKVPTQKYKNKYC